jgi:hypothetical protein
VQHGGHVPAVEHVPVGHHQAAHEQGVEGAVGDVGCVRGGVGRVEVIRDAAGTGRRVRRRARKLQGEEASRQVARGAGKQAWGIYILPTQAGRKVSKLGR